MNWHLKWRNFSCPGCVRVPPPAGTDPIRNFYSAASVIAPSSGGTGNHDGMPHGLNEVGSSIYPGCAVRISLLLRKNLVMRSNASSEITTKDRRLS